MSLITLGVIGLLVAWNLWLTQRARRTQGDIASIISICDGLLHALGLAADAISEVKPLVDHDVMGEDDLTLESDDLPGMDEGWGSG